VLPIPKGANSDFEMRLTNIWALMDEKSQLLFKNFIMENREILEELIQKYKNKNQTEILKNFSYQTAFVLFLLRNKDKLEFYDKTV